MSTDLKPRADTQQAGTSDLLAYLEPLDIADHTALSNCEIPRGATPRHDKTEDMPGAKGHDVRDSDSFREFLTPAADNALNLGHYEVQEVLGRGGFGIVIKAFDRKLHRVVAVKMMSTEMAATSPARKRFLREARASAAVRHENVVQIYGVEEEPIPYLVMEYIPGDSLQARLDRRGPLGVDEVVRIGCQIARGLAAAHDMKLVHRDIKPANILLEAGPVPQAKLTDFGLARAADDASLTQSGTVAGTPMYMAPEQASGETFDHRVDLFSLGSVLYVMASGRPPFRANSSVAVLKRVVEDTPRPIREIIPEVPQWLCDIISKLHEKKAENRFQTAAELAEVLEDCQRQMQVHQTLKDFSRIPHITATQRPISKLKPAALRSLAVAVGVFFAVVGLGLSGLLKKPATTVVVSAESPDRFTNAFGMEFVRVPKGKVWLGGGGGRTGAKAHELDEDIFLGTYEVTHADWEAVMGPGTNPSSFSRHGANSGAIRDIPDDELRRFPVDGVSWNQCVEFVARLNAQTQEPGWSYRLPTSDEWEYACRGGPGDNKAYHGYDFYFEEPDQFLDPRKANCAASQLNRPCRVGSGVPNRLGLFDLHGNVFEYCNNQSIDNNGGPLRDLRGGCWHDGREICRARNCSVGNPAHNLIGGGFRVARVPAVK